MPINLIFICVGVGKGMQFVDNLKIINFIRKIIYYIKLKSVKMVIDKVYKYLFFKFILFYLQFSKINFTGTNLNKMYFRCCYLNIQGENF